MKRERRWLFGIAVVLLSLWACGSAHADTRYRWDIPSLSFGPTTINAGGFATAVANGGSHITLIGSGTFVLENSDTVTGGGVWLTRGPLGDVTGIGTYQVTELVTFSEGPGRQAPPVVDNIAKLEDYRAGVALLRVAFSDGSRGILTVMCRVSAGPTPSGPIYREGITVLKGPVPYWHPEDDLPGIDGNRTAFHVVP